MRENEDYYKELERKQEVLRKEIMININENYNLKMECFNYLDDLLHFFDNLKKCPDHILEKINECHIEKNVFENQLNQLKLINSKSLGENEKYFAVMMTFGMDMSLNKLSEIGFDDYIITKNNNTINSALAITLGKPGLNLFLNSILKENNESLDKSIKRINRNISRLQTLDENVKNFSNQMNITRNNLILYLKVFYELDKLDYDDFSLKEKNGINQFISKTVELFHLINMIIKIDMK